MVADLGPYIRVWYLVATDFGTRYGDTAITGIWVLLHLRVLLYRQYTMLSVFVWWGHAMYTPTRIAGREAVVEFLRHKLRAYQIIYKDCEFLYLYSYLSHK